MDERETDEVRGQIVKAFVVLRDGHAPGATSQRALQDHCNVFRLSQPEAQDPTGTVGTLSQEALR